MAGQHAAGKPEPTGPLFRQRLAELLRRSGRTQAAFAREIGIDRSTLSQLLAGRDERLPRADGLVAIARSQKVSIDWLLGLTEEGPMGADIVRRSAFEIERGGWSPADERLAQWHEEAAGYKIRYVPATLPDLLKTDRVLHFEYGESESMSPDQASAVAQAKIEYLHRPETEMEVCNSRQSVEAFARGEGLWRGLSVAARRAQLVHMIALCEELYPTFRWFLYDGRKHYSAPVTVFGPKRAVLYVGPIYLVFNSTEHIRVLTAHFDGLIRGAVLQPVDVVAFLRRLLAEIGG